MLLRHLYITDLRRLAQGRSNTMMEKISKLSTEASQ